MAQISTDLLQRKKSSLEKKYPIISSLGDHFDYTESDDWIDDFDGCPFDVNIEDDQALFQELSRLAGTSTQPYSPSMWQEYSKRHQSLTTKLSLKAKLVETSTQPYSPSMSQEYPERTKKLLWEDYKGMDISALLPLYKGVYVEHLEGPSGDSNIDPAHGDSGHVSTHSSFYNIVKYWSRRYILFSLYDEGIRLDIEGWFSATPECIAKHHASRCLEGVVGDCLVVDAFSGVGGNCIRFAEMENTRVIAIDMDEMKIKYASHNAVIYGVRDKIAFCPIDFFKEALNLKASHADVVFLSPPWGGPAYIDEDPFDITNDKPFNGKKLFDAAKHIAPKVVMFLPRTVNIGQLVEIALSVSPPWKLEVEMNKINGVEKTITAYFTNPVKRR